MKRWIILFWIITAPAWAQSNHVIVISLDGCRPEFYLPGALTKTLTSLCERGSYARGALPPYPSMTYPGHTTIATGTLPARHGVNGNSLFEPPKVESRGYWYASDIKVPALWDVAHAAGLTVGTVVWPCTADSKAIDWNVTEFWTTPLGKELDLMREHSTPGLLTGIESVARGDAAAWDAYMTKIAAQIIQEHKPNLLFLHLLEADKVQHHGGRTAPELPEALQHLDADVQAIIDAAQKAGIVERTTFIVLGDHGFADISQTIAPNSLLASNGFITVTDTGIADWRAMVVNTGGSAGVYLNHGQDAAEVRALLEKNGKRLYRIIDKEELVKLGGPRDAAFYLEAEPGYMFVGGSTGKTLVRPSQLKGNHGFLPTNPQLHTGFIAAGRGIKKGVVLDLIRLTDVAPTVARLLGLKLDETDGRVLEEILTTGGQNHN
jgi:predicted AlkP superfamily pyrophosphatase or phosphodiesterase